MTLTLPYESGHAILSFTASMTTVKTVNHPNQLGLPPEVERLKSWLPVDATIRDERPMIEWMNMSGVVLSEPFFQQTVDRVRKTVEAESLFTDLDVLIQLEKISDRLDPTGFIFHSSRCGSTLVANACKAIGDSIVIAESSAVDKLITRFFTDLDDAGTKELLYSVFLRGAIHALGQRRMKNERHYFVKFASTSTLQFARIRKIWPKVPAVFLYRDPIEVMVSNLKTIPEWMIIETNPATAAATVGVGESEVSQIGREEFCARALGRYYSAAEANADQQTWLVNYDELTPDLLLRIISFFGVIPSSQEAQTISQTARLYSKDAVGRTTFHGDREEKRTKASAQVREMADRWATPAYQRLESKRQIMTR